MSSKVGKIVLALALLAVAAVVAYRAFSSDSPVAREFQFVDVATGELFNLDMREVGIIPARSPRTGEYTLLPCKPDESGILRVPETFRGSLHDDLKSKNQFVDAFTMEVKKSNGN